MAIEIDLAEEVDLASLFDVPPVRRPFPKGLVLGVACSAIVLVLGIGGAMQLSGDEVVAGTLVAAAATPPATALVPSAAATTKPEAGQAAATPKKRASRKVASR